MANLAQVLVFVFTVVWLGLVLALLPLNAALALGWHQRSKALVFIGFFS